MSRGLLIALISAVLVLALGVAGIAAYLFLGPKDAPAATGDSHAEAPAETKKATKVGASLELKKFVTNLADSNTRYIDVTVALGVADEAAKEELNEMTPQVRDVIVKTIRSMSSADLTGPQGMDKLSEAITTGLEAVEGVNELVLKVYVTDMVIQ